MTTPTTPAGPARATLGRAVTVLRRRHRTGVALLAVPLLVAGLLAWSHGNGLSGTGSATAAVVNNDRPVTINGQIVPLGRQLAGLLVDGKDKRYTWALTNDADARDGLASGRYSAVVTVPPTFSGRATSAATTKDPLTATQGAVSIETARDATLSDPVLTDTVVAAATTALNAQVVQTYLDNVYVGFSTIRTKIGTAADGAAKVADGAQQVTSGTRSLADGSGTLLVGLRRLSAGADQAAAGAARVAAGADQAAAGARRLAAGADRLAAGAGQLSRGTAKLATGADALAAGTRRLSAGAGRLSTGLDTLARSTAPLPAQTRRLAAGARKVADGNRQLADQVVPVTSTVVRIIDTVPDLAPVTVDLDAVARQCAATGADLPVCAQIRALAERWSGRLAQVDRIKKDVRGRVVTLQNGVTALADGSEQVAQGAARLAAGAPKLARGTRDAAAGGRQVAAGARASAAGARRVASGAHSVATGARRVAAGAQGLRGGARALATGTAALEDGAHDLADGVGTLATGTGDARTGAGRLADGADRLAGGAGRLATGATTLADGLDSSRTAVPSYTPAERARLSVAAATPILTQPVRDAARIGAAGLFVVLALWIGGLGAFLLLRPAPDALTSTRATWQLAVRTAAPALGAVVVVAAVLAGAVAWWLELSAGRTLAVVAVAVLAAVACTLINQALAAVLGRTGRLVALGVAVVTLAAGATSTVPAALAGLARSLPTHDAAVALRSAAAGGVGLPGSVLMLVVWSIVAGSVVIWATERRRALAPGGLGTSS